MGFCNACSGDRFRSISSAMAKAAGATLRQFGALKTADDWTARAAVCERCPMRVVRRNVSYCGKPFLADIDRDPAVDGCGCPTRAKAKSPGEHCPISVRTLPARVGSDGKCDCKWCRAATSERRT